MITKEQLKFLSDHGIEFIYHSMRGWQNYSISINEIIELLSSDRLRFDAKLHGVGIEHYEEWLESMNDGRCKAITKKGTRCLLTICCPFDPLEFKPGITNRCWIHQNIDSK